MDEDEEYEYDYGSDEEYNYGSDEEGGDDNNIPDELIEIENAYYEGDDERLENPSKAIEKFEKVVELESSRGPDVKWRFKALQNLVVLYYQQGLYSQATKRYRDLLSYLHVVTRNECTDAVNVILDTMTTAADVNVLSEMYEITLQALKTANNERLWFNTNLKLARVYLESKKVTEVEDILSKLKSSCLLPNGTEDPNKGNLLLEIYCLEIQLCSMTMNSVRMREIYPKTVHLNAVISDPRTMGVIREEGGKLYMAEGNWDEAYNELYQAFRNYQEAGNMRAKDCLKYVVLASMLALTDINPFAAREAKVFVEDREIIAMSELRDSLEANDLNRFEKTIQYKANRILDEPFLMKYIEPLRRRMREQAILGMIKPFEKVQISYIAQALSLQEAEVEEMTRELILNERLEAAKIHGVGGYILVTAKMKNDHHEVILDQINEWMEQMKHISLEIDNTF